MSRDFYPLVHHPLNVVESRNVIGKVWDNIN